MPPPDEKNTEAKEGAKAADVREGGWKWWLPYLGGIVTFIALIGSLITFSVSKIIDISKHYSWKEKVMVISYRSEGPQVFLNAGDGQVFLSHMQIESETNSMTRPVNSIIKPGEFYTLPLQPNPDLDKGGVISGISADEWKNFVEKYRTEEKHSLHPSLFMVYYSSQSPALLVYKRVLKEKLRTIPATGTMVYFSSRGGQQFEETIPLEGVLVMKQPDTTVSK